MAISSFDIETPLPAAPTAPLLGTQGGKENHVADAGRAGQEHEQPVDANADAAGGRHAVFERAQVVLVHPARLLVALGPQPRLRLEAAALVDGVVQLTERV